MSARPRRKCVDLPKEEKQIKTTLRQSSKHKELSSSSSTDEINENTSITMNTKKSNTKMTNNDKSKPSPVIRTKLRRRQRPISESEDDESSAEEKIDVTPPKLKKPSKKDESKMHTPIKLLDRMSLDERPDDIQDEPQPSNNLQNIKKTLSNGQIENLPGREEELNQLSDIFTQSLLTKVSSSMYISGPPGTGKTACLSKLLQTKEFSSKFKTVYINCTGIASVGSVYKYICAELGITSASVKENLENIIRYLTKSKKMILMVLDEIDQLVGQKQSVLYTIFEWPAIPKSKLLLIGIANSLDLTDRMLSRLNAKCELRPKLMHFAPYTKQQIVNIFTNRLENAGMMNVFPPITIQLLAAKVAAVSGDVRRALDIGRRVIEMAESNRKLNINDLGVAELSDDGAKPIEKVEIKQVMSVLNDVYGASQNLTADIEDSYPLHQKILICSLLLLMKRSKNKVITIGRLHGVYTKICSKRNIDSIGQSEIVSMCALIETRGIIKVISKKEPRLSQVQLQWNEEEVTAALKDKQLIASILADTTIIIQ